MEPRRRNPLRRYPTAVCIRVWHFGLTQSKTRALNSPGVGSLVDIGFDNQANIWNNLWVDDYLTIAIKPVPEPSTLPLLGGSLIVALLLRPQSFRPDVQGENLKRKAPGVIGGTFQVRVLCQSRIKSHLKQIRENRSA